MRRIIVVIIVVIFCFNLSNAGEKVFLDNEYIQEYKGVLGKWVSIESKYSLFSNAKRFSIPLKEIYAINGINKIKDIVGKYIFVPYSQEYIRYLKSQGISRAEIECSENQFIWPLSRVVRITSVLGLRWGKFHPGVDMPAVRGTMIYASMGGMVVFSGYAGGYGLSIEIEHRNNFKTKYAHNSVMFVKKGEFVKKGQLIGLVGSTGNSTGPHLHFEIRSNGVPLDPLDFLPVNNNLKVVHTLKNWK